MMRLCAVSYLNTKPFLAGLAATMQQGSVQVHEMVPSACAASFAAGECEMGLIPAGALLGMDSVQLLDKYCIGANGAVDSVLLLANEPISHLHSIWLDPHSRTSNGLVQILMQQLWQQPVQYHMADAQLPTLTPGQGAVCIGDRAIAARQQYAYSYDLAAAWQTWCGLPFVFAVWAYRPARVPAAVLAQVAQAFDWGMQHLPQVARQWHAHFGMTYADTLHYLQHFIDYRFDAAKHQALHLYLQHWSALQQQQAPIIAIQAA